MEKNKKYNRNKNMTCELEKKIEELEQKISRLEKDNKEFFPIEGSIPSESQLDASQPQKTKEELIDYATRSGAPLEVLENLQEIEDEGEVYESIEDIWPDYPSKDDFLWNDDEY